MKCNSWLGFPELKSFKKTDEKAEFIINVRKQNFNSSPLLTLTNFLQALGPNIRQMVK